MANRTVVVDLIVNTAKWTAGFQKASHDMASATTNAETKTRALQMQVGLLGVGMTAFAALGVRAWARFDQGMARVEATGGSAAKSIGLLTEAAKSDEVTQLGYSATEAAESIYELTKAGVSANDIISGGLTGSLALAAAETMDAAEAATIMASALSQFNLEGEQSAHVADLLTAAAGKAQGSAHDLGFALKQSGLVANQFGLSIEETTGSLALFANAGLIGSDAGTSLRTMLLHLVGPSGKSAALMKEIGLEVYGANGQFVGMEALANNLQGSLGALSEEQRNQALATIFGADATRAASLLYREGGDAVAEWTAKVNDAGYAQEVARKRMDTLNGDLKILSATWEKFLIGMGESADAPLRSLVQGVTGLVDAFADLPPAAQGIIMALAGGGGLGVLGVLAISQVISALNTLETGLVSTGLVGEATAKRISTGMKIATLAVSAMTTAAVIGLTVFAQKTAEAAARVEEWKATLNGLGGTTHDTLSLINENLSKSNEKWFSFGQNTESITQLTEKYGIALSDVQQGILGNEEAYDRVISKLSTYEESVRNGSAEASEFGADLYRIEKAMVTQRAEIARATTEQERKAAADKLAGVASEELGGAVGDTTTTIEEQTEAIQANIDSWHELAGIHMDADEALANYEQSIDDADEAIKAAQTDTEKYSSLLRDNQKSLDLNTQAGRDTQSALQGISEAALKAMQSQYDAGASTADLTKQMQGARRSFIDAAVSAGLTRQAARELADSYGLIPENVNTTLSARDNASGVIKSVKQQLAELRDQTVYITTVRRNATERARTGSGIAGGFAAGGPIYGGVQGKDSVPIMAMPGEHMLTTKDVAAMGGQQAVYAFRSALHSAGSGLMGFARGGAIPSGRALHGHSLAYWADAYRSNLEQTNLQMRIGGLRRDLRERGDDALPRLARRAALSELRSALSELKDSRTAEKIGSPADFRRWMTLEQREKDKRAAGRDLRKSIIRGELKDSLTSGMSGVYSVTDEAQSLISDHTVTGKAADRLQDAIYKTNIAARGLYREMDKIEGKLERAAARAEELRDIKESVAGSITGGFSLSDARTTNPWSGEQVAATGSQMLAAAQAYATKAKVFGKRLAELQKRGFSGVILQEIASMGVEAGIAAADALLTLSATDTTSLNEAYERIDHWAQFAGEAVTGGFFKGGLAAADGIVKGLESQQDKVEAAIEKMALGMQEALKRALGIHSPSTVIRDLMNPVGDGAVIGLYRQKPKVGAAMGELFDTGNYVNPTSYGNSTAGSYSAGSATNVTKIVNIEVTSHNAVAEKDSVIVNRALQSAAAIGD